MSAAWFTSDWHWHSRNSCDCRQGPLPTPLADSVAAVRARGIEAFGLTDHLHTPLNLPDLEASRKEFDALPPAADCHFGVEVSCVSKWELERMAEGGHEGATYGIRSGGPAGAEPALALTAATRSRLGIEYVVGGAHWPLYVAMERDAVIRDYHRQNLFLACHPLVDIVAHPWWWMGHWMDADGCYRGDPWLDDFSKVPRSMHDEFAAACREHGTVVEINLYAMLMNRHYPPAFRRQYADYLATLKEAGLRLSVGSDYHAQHHRYGEASLAGTGAWADVTFGAAAELLNAAGIREEDLWRLT